MDSNMLLAGLLVLVLLVIGLWMWRRNRSEHLERHFGPEYRRAVHEMGSRDKAEAELMARQKRVQDLDLRPLTPADAQRYSQQWRSLQARFVDNPKGSLVEADQLVRDLMQQRGYPMGDFERRAADISVHHPQVVEHYRAAHQLTELDRRGQVDTEGMRQAVIHYRALFADLLQTDEQRREDERQTNHHGMRAHT